MPRKTKEQKAEALIDDRITKAYYAGCSGIQIDIMDIRKVFVAGRKAIADNPGIDETGLTLAVRAFVETIRHN